MQALIPLLSGMLKQADHRILSASEKAFLQQVTEAVEANLEDERFGVEELAEKMALSRSQVHRKLQDMLGIPPSSFIRQIRLSQAKKMLEEGAGTAAEIAYRVGFNSPTYFNTCFHEQYGFTPGEIQRRKDRQEGSVGDAESFLEKLRETPKSERWTREFWKDRIRGGNRKVINYGVLLIILLGILGWLFLRKGAPSEEGPPVQPLTTISNKSIAILPFKNLSDETGNQYFADGVMEAILNHLSRINDLRVVSRTSVEQYRQSIKSASQIGQELGVDHLLEGSAQQQGNMVRITVQLIEAEKDDHLWSESYDRELSDLFKTQSEIAEKIAKVLEAKLTPKEKQLIETVPTTNLKAYDFYLRGRENHHRWQSSHNEEDFIEAISLYRQSLNLDPEFALPYMEMGWFYWWKFFFTDQKNYLDTVLVYANKTLDINPSQSEGYALRGLYFFTTKDKHKSLKELKKAIELKPNNPTALRWLGFLYFMEFNDYEKAFVNYKKSEKLEYGWEVMLLYTRLGEFYLSIGDYEKAQVYYEKLVKLWPDPIVLWWQGWLATIQGEFEDALKIHQQILSFYPEDLVVNILVANNLAYLKRFQEAEEYWKKATDTLQAPLSETYDDMRMHAYTLWMNGKEDEAERLFNEQISLCLDSIRLDKPYKENGAYFDLAATYAFLGNKEEAYKWLKEQEKIGFCFVLFPEKLGFFISGLEDLMLHDPMFESLWEDEEFKEIVERVHTEKAEIRTRINQLAVVN